MHTDIQLELLPDPRHSYTTRLLATLLPSNWYAKKDKSVNGILQALADDLRDLFETGVTVQARNTTDLIFRNKRISKSDVVV